MRCPDPTRSARWPHWPHRLLLFLCLFAVNLTTAQSAWDAGATGWCQEPGIGEADNPGPAAAATAARAAFDDEDAQAWSEDEAEPTPVPGEPMWEPSPDDEAYGDDPLAHELLHPPHPHSGRARQKWQIRCVKMRNL